MATWVKAWRCPLLGNDRYRLKASTGREVDMASEECENAPLLEVARIEKASAIARGSPTVGNSSIWAFSHKIAKTNHSAIPTYPLPSLLTSWNIS